MKQTPNFHRRRPWTQDEPAGAWPPTRGLARGRGRGGCSRCRCVVCCFFFNDTATTEIYTLSLHDALPISRKARCSSERCGARCVLPDAPDRDRKSTRLNSSHLGISYAVFCLKKKK